MEIDNQHYKEQITRQENVSILHTEELTQLNTNIIKAILEECNPEELRRLRNKRDIKLGKKQEEFNF